ncbi:cache domain-containing protein [Dyadobacter bucti]|uniref:cache domain-containing protein n=1 Tax=Dyadobacter bucti TaxID=2572203 RepID=UPI003F720E0E
MTFPTVSAERLPLLITLSIVICLGAGYYFIYIPGNETRVKQWKFRALQHAGKNIQEKISTGHKQLKTYLESDSLNTQELDSANAHLIKLRNDKTLPFSKILELGSEVFTPDKLSSQSSPKQLTLTDTIKRDQKTYHLNLIYNFSEFIEPILPKQVFDEYLIVGEDVIIYETFTSGVDPSQDTLFRSCGKLRGALMTDREYAGTVYKLFILPVDLNANSKILLVGLLTADNFSEARTSFPPRLILFLITVLTCILVTIPIIKLYQLSDGDRLTVKDVISVTIVSSLLLSLLFFCFVRYSTIFSEDKRHAKELLADTISTAFVREIEENYRKLDVLNNCVEQDSMFDDNFYNLGGTAAGSSSACQMQINSEVKGTDLDRLFWADKDGKEIRTWTVGEWGFFPGQFSERAYFKSTLKGQTYSLSNVNGSQLYVDQIVSWVSGKFLTVIAKPSNAKKTPVAVILFDAKSLKKSKIPPGYAFAMIDYNGRVLYHSDAAKNLNENLFEEFSDQKSLQSSIQSGANSEPSFKTQYYGHEYEVQMRPVGSGLPFYLVIMEDLMFEEYRDINVYTFTFSMQLLLYGLIIIQALAIFLASSRRLRIKGKKYETSWLGPKKMSRKEYFTATIFNICLFILLAFIFTGETILSRIFMLLSSIAIMPVCLNMLFYKRYVRRGNTSLLANAKLRSASVGAAFLLPLLIASNVLPEAAVWTLILFDVIVLGLGVLLYYKQWYFPRHSWLLRFFCFEKAYTCMLVSWLLVSMGLPMVLFFKAAYNYDQHLIARYMQLEMAEANAGEIARLLRKSGDTLDSLQKTEIINNFYKDHYWVNSVSIDSIKGPFHEVDEASINLLRSFHLYSNDKTPDRLHINNSSAFDFSFYFNNLLRQDPQERGASVTYYRLSNRNNVVIKSAPLDFHLPDISHFSGLLPWLIFLAALVAFCFVVFGLVRKIFSLDMISEYRSPAFDCNSWLAGDNTDKVFLVRFPGKCPFPANQVSGGILLNFVEMPLIKPLPNSDWVRKVNSATQPLTQIVVFEHFEHDFKSIETNNRKLELLEKTLRVSDSRKLLVCSTLNPAAMLAACKAAVSKDATAKDTILQSEERWHNLLRSFNILIDPVKENVSPDGVKLTDTQIFDRYVGRFHDYFSVWQSLSEEEKFVLYDLSEDGLVNTYDKDAFRLLIRKGLIVQRNGRFRLFDKSFRNFILSGLSRSELAAIMEKINDNTNWNKIRIPLMLVSLAILVFIISSQREASVKFLTTLGALATAIPALINILSAISGMNKKSAS